MNAATILGAVAFAESMDAVDAQSTAEPFQEIALTEPEGVVQEQAARQPINNAGMIIVLIVVALLMILFQMLDRMKQNASRQKSEEEAETSRPVEQSAKPVLRADKSESSGYSDQAGRDDSDELAAVVAAAAMMMLETAADESADEKIQPIEGLRIRRPIRSGRVALAWSRAGREEQIYSRI
ncbi:MAG: OadG family protein [Oscillospiraceae bacterium]|jgi:flagellar biosynthesis/type III secretory pathway M-ring protein FliF/YscJ|nr:OadG family protein [Oscillospiraceae bacterium]